MENVCKNFAPVDGGKVSYTFNGILIVIGQIDNDILRMDGGKRKAMLNGRLKCGAIFYCILRCSWENGGEKPPKENRLMLMEKSISNYCVQRTEKCFVTVL